MVAVVDASPVCYLILTGEVDLLKKLFDAVLMPETVLRELLDERAPAPVRSWAASLPPWINIYPDPDVLTAVGQLDAGERAAIFLAERMKADVIVLDEKAARRAASERGLRVTGVLGLLVEGSARGFIDLPAVLQQLTKTNFRYPPALLRALADRHRKT